MKKLYYPLLSLAMPFFLVTSVLADEYGIDKIGNASGLTAESGGQDLIGVIGNVIGVALSLVAIIFFIMVVYGGFKWMFARGNEDDTKTALEIIWGSVIGLIIVLAAYAITTFVLNNIHG